MIYGRFGDTVTVLRYATVDDVKRLDPPLDNDARVNLSAKSWVVTDSDGVERISHLAYLRADDGLPEIIKALEGQTWECPYCGKARPVDERCPDPACEKEDTMARRRHARRSA